MIERPAVVGLLSVLLAATATALEDPPVSRYQGKCSDAGCHGGYTERKFVHAPISQGACDACHEALPNQEHKFKFVQEGPALCKECHEDVTENMPFVHGPVSVGSCTSCHDPHASDRRLIFRDDERKVCLDCHTDLDEKLGASKSPHGPVREGCTSCHKGHGGKNKLFLTSEAPALCFDCHDDVRETVEEGKVKHDAMAGERSCLGCHDPHASTHGKLLAKSGGEVCLSCHDKEVVAGDRKIANIAALLSTNPHRHKPAEDGACGACHDPHGGARSGLLTRAYPEKLYAPFKADEYALCLDCHEGEAFTEKETDEATGFRNGKINLHYLHVNRPSKGRTCRMCHDPHAVRGPKLVADSVPFGGWRIPINFKDSPTGGSCQPGCHTPQKYDREHPTAAPGAPQPDDE